MALSHCLLAFTLSVSFGRWNPLGNSEFKTHINVSNSVKLELHYYQANNF